MASVSVLGLGCWGYTCGFRLKGLGFRLQGVMKGLSYSEIGFGAEGIGAWVWALLRHDDRFLPGRQRCPIIYDIKP